MGKRELLLIVLFVAVGAVVYQVSAPPPAPGERSFSVGQLVDHLRRGLRGNRASAEATMTSHHAVDPAIAELRVNARMGELAVIGEDRTDIEAELRVRSNGFDQAEAERLAHETKLEVETSGARLVAGVVYPQAGSQRTLRLTLKVPARLQIILDAGGGPVNVTSVAGVELSSARGETRIRHISGKVTGTHRGGELSIADSRSVKLTTMGTDVQLDRIADGTTLNLRSGEVRAGELGGPVEIEAQGADITIDKPQKVTGVLRITAASGSVRLSGLESEARIDARNAEVEVVAARPAPVAIYSEGNGSVEVTPAAGGYQLDALATNADISLPEGTLEITSNGEEHRAAGAVHGGGPTLTIRTAHAEIAVRQR
jgi:hypothetical protein